MSGYVLDASVVAAWLLPAQATTASEALLTIAYQTHFLVPKFFVYEVRRIILKGERSGALNALYADAALDELWSYPIAIDPETEGALDRCFDLARTEALSFYDALYLDVALRTDLTLASRDAALLAAARRRDLPVYDARSPP